MMLRKLVAFRLNSLISISLDDFLTPKKIPRISRPMEPFKVNFLPAADFLPQASLWKLFIGVSLSDL